MLSRHHRNSSIDPALVRRLCQISLLVLTWLAIYVAALATPALLDDADATHAQAAQAMLQTGDWVTLHVDGIRYLEKPPLPYWMAACSLRLFGNNSFAVHLPLALTIAGLAVLAWLWGRHAFGERTGFYAPLFMLTATGTFLFTRIFIPDALLSLLLACALYAALRALALGAAKTQGWAGTAWLALAAAVLAKGLVALVLTGGALAIYCWISGEARRWRQLHPGLGCCLLLVVAAPWHILAGLRNVGGAGGHGFFWFYFVNEHVLRFLGRRSPPDYNKLPFLFFWSLHLVWLFPWSPLLPAAAALAWSRRRYLLVRPDGIAMSFAHRSVCLLTIFSAVVLLFFSLSTNQEYYTFPVYLPLLLLGAAGLAAIERNDVQEDGSNNLRRILLAGHVALVCIGLVAAGALAYALWSSRTLPAAPDVGTLLAHRGVGNYTLSMSHFFDLTGPSFSALRLPASLACIALASGPVAALFLRRRGWDMQATLAVAGTGVTLLIAAHLALTRFAPMLSSANFARVIQQLESDGAVERNSEVMMFGDQALGSSLPFYLGRPVELVDGRSTSMLFGSTFRDAPPIFLTREQLFSGWEHGPRKLLFIPLEHRAEVDAVLGARQVLVYESAGKALVTDRPMTSRSSALDTTVRSNATTAAGSDHHS